MADNQKILKNAEFNAKLGTLSGILSGASSLYAGITGMKTAKIYGRMQQRAAESQARLNELATERNIAYQTRQAQDQIADVRRGGRQALGRQLATMAATGVSTASGSAQALLRSTGLSIGRDISTIQANLINAAFEQRRQTAIENIGLQYQGQMARYTARAEGFSSLAAGMQGVLSAATSVADRWDRLNTLRYKTQPDTQTISTSYQPNNLSNVPSIDTGYSSIYGATDYDVFRNQILRLGK